MVRVTHRFVSYRPLVELLEARLPPGDAFFGALLGGAMLPAERATGLVPVVSAARPGPARSLAYAAFLDEAGSFALLPEAAAVEAAPTRAEPLRATDEPFPQTTANRRLPLLRPDAAAIANPGAMPSDSLAIGTPSDFHSTVFVTPPPANYQLDQAVGALIPPTDSDDGAGIQSSGVRALFNLDHPNNGPFPSNVFTVSDRTMNTNLRINLPFPDCKVYVSDCEDLAVLNELDGFNLQPRLSVPFSGPIDVNTATSETVFLISLGSTVPGQGYMPRGTVVGINQIVWDVETNTLHVESDELLAQHTRFALIVTNGVRDADGDRVEASQEFRLFRETAPPAYRRELEDAIAVARRLGISERQMVTASVFTTQSATAVLEKIRDQIKAQTPEPADFLLGPKGERTVFNLSAETGITWRQQTQVQPPVFNPVDLNLDLLRDIFPGAVGQLAFGSYLSPDYLVHPDQYFPSVGTRTGTPVVQGVNELFFNLVLPSGKMPSEGWPVAIFGHPGGPNTKDTGMVNVAASMARQGIATLLINTVGSGFGPLGTLTVRQAKAEPLTFSAGGRGIDQNEDNTIGPTEGAVGAAPRGIVDARDTQRQTVADLLQLVRVLEVGMDLDGDKSPDLNANRIYYFGASLGGFVGTQFLAVEPSVRAGVLNVTGGARPNNVRLSPVLRPNQGSSLAGRTPGLLNAPGVSLLDGVMINMPRFHDNLPLRNGLPLAVTLADGTDVVIQSPVVNTAAGTMAIQDLFDNIEWAALSGQALAYAPHLRKAPLPGVPAKSVIFQFAKGDQTVSNPTSTETLRAGDLADRATYYRHDLAYAEQPTLLPRNPHAHLTAVDNAFWQDVALGTQSQIATFFASDGKEIIHPEPKRFFEVPIKGPLPEELNYIP